jgi:hypothetical protein
LPKYPEPDATRFRWSVRSTNWTDGSMSSLRHFAQAARIPAVAKTLLDPEFRGAQLLPVGEAPTSQALHAAKRTKDLSSSASSRRYEAAVTKLLSLLYANGSYAFPGRPRIGAVSGWAHIIAAASYILRSLEGYVRPISPAGRPRRAAKRQNFTRESADCSGPTIRCAPSQYRCGPWSQIISNRGKVARRTGRFPQLFK